MARQHIKLTADQRAALSALHARRQAARTRGTRHPNGFDPSEDPTAGHRLAKVQQAQARIVAHTEARLTFALEQLRTTKRIAKKKLLAFDPVTGDLIVDDPTP